MTNPNAAGDNTILVVEFTATAYDPRVKDNSRLMSVAITLDGDVRVRHEAPAAGSTNGFVVLSDVVMPLADYKAHVEPLISKMNAVVVRVGSLPL